MGFSSLGLDAFQEVVRSAGFTKAASRLHITQSALSQRILNLEEELGTALLIRDRSGLRLTAAGEELLRYCQAREALEGEVLGRLKTPTASGGLSGWVRIGGFSSVMRSVVLPSLKPLFAKNPGLRLSLQSRELRDLPDLLKRGEIDYMILDQEWAREGVASVRLGEERSVLVEREAYAGPDVFLDHDEDDPTTARYLDLRKGRSSQARAGAERMFFDDIYGILDGVKQGLGRAVLPEHLIRGESRLAVLDPERVLRTPVVLHHYVQPYYTRLHEGLMKAIEEGARHALR